MEVLPLLRATTTCCPSLHSTHSTAAAASAGRGRSQEEEEEEEEEEEGELVCDTT